MYRKQIYALLLLLMLAGFLQSARAQIASGGSYVLDQSVIANGGLESAGGTYSIVGTPGQPFAGTLSTAGRFGVRGGFWQGFLAPTAASVSINGRVTTADGRAVSRAIVIFTSASGASHISISNPFGYYWIDGIEAGQAYIITVSAKSLQFAPRAIMIQDSLADLDLVMLG